MQLTCRRCLGSFTVVDGTSSPCPACGAFEVQPTAPTRSPRAATTERQAPVFSAPVSQPLPPSHYGAPAGYAGPADVGPSYPAPPMAPGVAPALHAAAPGAAPTQPGWYGQPPYAPYPHQPVQVVIQNQVHAYGASPYGAAPYATAPYVKRKDAGVATLLSFFLPGAGQLYNGQVAKGLGFLLVSLFVNFPLMFIGIGFLTGFATWLWSMIDAHQSAERINRGLLLP